MNQHTALSTADISENIDRVTHDHPVLIGITLAGEFGAQLRVA